ncbi:MAG: division/cell wall cluster transcriptional repressor MraZ [Bacilli bacterium]|nr:division/cell wall cluster transcriptional repressor MraZ [Bacilli bacterium]
MFVGQSIHSLDNKNRLVLPAKYRSQLSSVVYLSLDLDSCLSIYSEDVYGQKAEKINALSDFDKDSRALKRIFFANSCEVTMDKQGRIMIPMFLLEKVKIEKEVVVVGAFDHIQLFSNKIIDGLLVQDESCYEELASHLNEAKKNG